MWNPFKNINKNAPTIKDLSNIPKELKDSAYNKISNTITIRYFLNMNFNISQDITGEIIHDKGLPLIIFDRPFQGAILFLEDCTYINQSKDNELTIDLVKDYPFGIDHKSDLLRFDNITYANKQFEIKICDSQSKYYKKSYKLYIPMMLNRTPMPIIRLDDADRLLKPVNLEEVKRLANITQVFLRSFIRINLLLRTGNKNQNLGFIALFFILIGFILDNFIRLFIK
jgi:hypothetical protein